MNNNHHSVAKWLYGDTGQLPPVAFVVPMTDTDFQILEAAPSGEAGEKWTTQWATTEFKSRYAGALPRFEDEARVAADQVNFVDERLHGCQEELRKTPDKIVTSRTEVEFPAGFLGRWLKFVGLLLCSQILLEWWNGASFARFELQDMKAALAFMFSLALAPIALKLFCGEESLWRRILFLSLSCGAVFFFVHVFTDSYINTDPNLSADQLLDRLGQPPVEPPQFWENPLHPRWRFLWGTVLFTLTGFAFSNHLARHIAIVTVREDEDNPAFARLESMLKKLTEEREHWGKRQAEAEGNCREWQASLDRHVQRCLAHFHEEERRRREEEALENFLKQKADRRNRRFPGNNLNQRN